MGRTLAAALITLLVASGVGAIAASGPKDDAARCVTGARATTLLANADARVYEVPKGYAKDANAFRTAVYACRYKSGTRFLLGTAWQTADENLPNERRRYIRSLTLSRAQANAPPRVAFVDTNCLDHPCASRVVVRTLTSGKVLFRGDAGSPFDELSLGVAKGGGPSLAWLETAEDGTCDGGCTVHLVKRSGDDVLDEGPDLDPDVFGAVESTRPGVPCCGQGADVFVWKRGAVLKSASFAG